ncbi:MAG: Gfo/Idh/MocA family oxidoreductase [Clostridia bacterium]
MPELKVAIIGLDSSHSIQFAMRTQAPDCPEDQKVKGLRIVSCMRFETPFQDKKGLDARQTQLEAWGVHVTEDFGEAVRDCDAIMLEINDPSLHLAYFEKAVKLGKPMFLDKPLADTIENGIKIFEIAKMHQAKVFSSSSLRFVPEVVGLSDEMKDPMTCSVLGPLGIALAGDSVIWYGVHTFEMLQKLMGRGARSVQAIKDDIGVVVTVEYENKRRGIVELTEDAFVYGGTLRGKDTIRTFAVNMDKAYKSLLDEIAAFFMGGPEPVALLDTLEVMDMMDATVKSLKTGKKENLATI